MRQEGRGPLGRGVIFRPHWSRADGWTERFLPEHLAGEALVNAGLAGRPDGGDEAMKDGLGRAEERLSHATVEIGTRRFAVTRDHPFYFGRADGRDVAGLEALDMGVSSYAGSVKWDRHWLVANTSHKCQLFLDEGGTAGPQLLECLHAQVVNVERLVIWVPGSIRCHEIALTIPVEDLPDVDLNRPSSGTLADLKVVLSDRERLVVVALFEGYLLPPPRYEAFPRSYADAGARLDPPRSRDSVRKQVEHLRDRLRDKHLLYFEGPRANNEMAEYFLRTKVITEDDLRLLPVR
jgi:hypothetical protein